MVRKSFIFGIVALGFSLQAQAKTIDCNFPQDIKQKVICFDDDLRQKNQKLNDYFKTPDIPPEVGKSFETYLAYHQKNCQNKTCLNKLFDYALNWFEQKEYQVQYKEDKKQRCFIKNLQPECEVYAYSQYNGERLSSLYIDNNQENYQTDIKINRPGKCVVLFLNSYEATIWNLYITPETGRVAVVAGGYYPQMLKGMNEKVETINRRKSPDEDCLSNYVEKDNFVREIKRLNLPISGIALLQKPVIGDLLPIEKYDYNPQIFDGEYVFVDLPPGEEGLKRLVQDGVLKRATKDDMEKIKAAGYDAVWGNGDTFLYHNAYILLKKLDAMPRGLTGGNLVNLFVPQNLPTPDMSDGHGSMFVVKAPADLLK